MLFGGNKNISTDGKEHLLPRNLRPGHPDAKVINGLGAAAAFGAVVCGVVGGILKFMGQVDEAYAQAHEK